MFERFLKGTKSATPPATPKAATPGTDVQRPVPAAKPAEAPEPPVSAAQAPSEPTQTPVPEKVQEPLKPVREEPMADSIDPAARPPMAHNPMQGNSMPSAVPELPDEEEAPEDALPVDDVPDNTPPPDPPSFLQEKDTPNEDSDDAKEEKKAPVIQPTMGATKEPETVRGESLHTVDFADIWYTPEGIAYVRDKSTRFALTPIETDDLEDFHKALEQGFTGMSSYAIKFAGDSYRVERVNTIDGLQYNCRKMPTTTPEIETLGFEPQIVKHLTSLSRSSGLLLFAGPTGQGKTTTVSSLMKRYLDTDGGFLYTIEDPPEMPLSGIYHSKNGGLGLCKQVPVENDQWGAGLRSALRSKPRYILVGEIRTPETASQCLVAATSGHLVLSTIHANGVEDALNSIIKYAASTGLDNGLVADLLARGILGVIHQRLEGTNKLKLVYQSAFANPNAQAADQMRMAIRDTNINLATFMEQQKTRLERGLPMFRE
ncbi:MAG: Flp pilus assembly complex ATPase component TadA [Alphaproteobacteria bacterium]|nr:Flp pilus assembly complex ATPase component TadA [Alphaproteobacteria bacterium]